MSEPFAVRVGMVLQRNGSALDVDCLDPSFAEWFVSVANYWRWQYLRVTEIVDNDWVGLIDDDGNELDMHRDGINATAFIPD